MNGLSAAERRSMIAQKVLKEGRVWTFELQKQFHVDQTSIWRDLRVLEQGGQLKRVHGGAVTLTVNARVESFAEKMKSHLKEKESIGQAAASLIDPHKICLFDSGTTTLQIVKHIPVELRQAHPLTLVTNSIPLTQEVLAWPQPNLILLGGIYLPEYQATVGPQTLSQLRELSADLVFLGTDGITLEEGVTTANILMAEVDRLMVERSRRAVLVTDSSKFGRVGFVPVTPVNAFQTLITDTNAPPHLVDAIRAQGVEVLLV